MQQLIDFIAVLAFVVVYFVTRDIFLATGVLLVGVTLQVGAYWLLKKPISNELKLTFWASLILGGMTLILRDDTFIKWKPTIVNWALAAVLLGGLWFGRTYLLQKMLGKVLDLPDDAWRVLTYGWAAGFFIAGAANLYVAFTYSMDTWVTFKLVGLMGLNLVYIIATFTYLGRKGLLTEENLLTEDTPKDTEREESSP
ncbi:MAG: inner membrane-spanning protein YciB [Pseudomonadota bacterium]